MVLQVDPVELKAQIDEALKPAPAPSRNEKKPTAKPNVPKAGKKTDTTKPDTKGKKKGR